MFHFDMKISIWLRISQRLRLNFMIVLLNRIDTQVYILITDIMMRINR